MGLIKIMSIARPHAIPGTIKIKVNLRSMKTLRRTETYQASQQDVFKTIDDLGISGMHMTQSSRMMMGSKLNLKFLTKNHTGLGSKYRWTGKMMGIKMDFTVQVTKWVKDVEKTWETIGATKLIIYSWFRMHLLIAPAVDGAITELSISYKKPRRLLNKLLSFLFADLYCKWCLRKMLSDAKKSLEVSKGRVISFDKSQCDA